MLSGPFPEEYHAKWGLQLLAMTHLGDLGYSQTGHAPLAGAISRARGNESRISLQGNHQ